MLCYAEKWDMEEIRLWRVQQAAVTAAVTHALSGVTAVAGLVMQYCAYQRHELWLTQEEDILCGEDLAVYGRWSCWSAEAGRVDLNIEPVLMDEERGVKQVKVEALMTIEPVPGVCAASVRGVQCIHVSRIRLHFLFKGEDQKHELNNALCPNHQRLFFGEFGGGPVEWRFERDFKEGTDEPAAAMGYWEIEPPKSSNKRKRPPSPE